MSRPIKFRAWDKAQGKWCKWEDQSSPTIDLYHCFRYNSLMVDNDQYDFPSEIILMQYTGLKDKNGVEVYEGDIVRDCGWEASSPSQVVAWNEINGAYGLKLRPEYECRSFAPNWPTLEVIGNIYENLDLTDKEEKDE